jgi:hypothetical protein
MQEFLQGTAVVQTAAYFGHQGLGDVKGEAAPWQATIEDVAEVLFPRKAGGAVFTDTGTAPQAQRPKGSGPEGLSLVLEPALDVGRGFGFRLHAVWMPYGTHTCQEKTFYKQDKKHAKKPRQELVRPLI